MKIATTLFVLLFSLTLYAQEDQLETAAQIDAYVAQFADLDTTRTYCKQEKQYGYLIYQAVDSNLVWLMDSWGKIGVGGTSCKMALKNNKLVYYNLNVTNETGIHQYILYYGKTGMLIDAAHKTTVTTITDNSISTNTNLESISAEDVKLHLKRYNDYHTMWEFNDYKGLTCEHE